MLHAVAAVLIRGFPLDGTAHAQVQRKLAEREAASSGRGTG